MEVADGIADELVEQRVLLGGRIRRVTADEAPQYLSILRIRSTGEVEQQREADGKLGFGQLALMDVPNRVHEFRSRLFLWIGREMADIFVDRARDHIEIETLRFARALIHVVRQAFGRRVSQPLLNGEAIPTRLRNLFALLVEK